MPTKPRQLCHSHRRPEPRKSTSRCPGQLSQSVAWAAPPKQWRTRPQHHERTFPAAFGFARSSLPLMPAALITFAHLSVSAAMNLPKSEGETGNAEEPRAASRAVTLGSPRPELNSLLSLSTISTGARLTAATASEASATSATKVAICASGYLIGNCPCRAFERVGVSVDQHRLAALGTDELSCGRSDAGAATGDQYYLIFDPVHFRCIDQSE
jgi:hypothetical protein